MAKSKYEYTRNFEVPDILLPQTWIVIRIDGQGFHKFTDKHKFIKPNDDRGLNLMNKAALEVLKEFPDITLAYGQSDEYSFVFKRDTALHNRRSSKLVSTVVSKFTSNYVFFWKEFFPGVTLLCPPSFDARSICYPSIKLLRDYLNWRQVDCHINNLYNTCFWNLVQDGLSKQEAQDLLKRTVSEEKREILANRFSIIYGETSQMHCKGSVIFKPKIPVIVNSFKNINLSQETSITTDPPIKRRWGKLKIHHIDIIQDQFWEEHPYLLEIPRHEIELTDKNSKAE